ncbi:hypothetical protein ACFC08_02285 [Streptomyces sp. NPDC056112]|uniref:hypothetical protein n=1 Tax=Streptomyces sp. NPDC056112 TaxID=3345715 RepID=UPI0035D544AD
MPHMPTAVRAVRVILFLVAPVSGTLALRFAVAGATVRSGAFGELIMGLLFLEALPLAVLAVLSLVVALKTAKGGNGVRAGAVVAGWLMTGAAVVGALAHHTAWGAGVVLGAVLLFLATGPDTRDWFDTPRL